MTSAETLATTRHGSKVHVSLGRLIICDFTETPHERIADFPATRDAERIATLFELGIRPSKLCFHCFPIRIRKALANAYRNA